MAFMCEQRNGFLHPQKIPPRIEVRVVSSGVVPWWHVWGWQSGTRGGSGAGAGGFQQRALGLQCIMTQPVDLCFIIMTVWFKMSEKHVIDL